MSSNFQPLLGLDDVPRHSAQLRMQFRPLSDEDDGMRYYEAGRYHYPSVTTVLSATADWREKKSFETYRKRNPGGMERAAHRGTLVHRFVEQFLRSGQIQLPSDPADLAIVKPFLNLRLLSVLKLMKATWWIEGSLHTDHPFLVDTEHGYAGCPDMIVHIPDFQSLHQMPVLTLVDLKTSESPYQPHQPRRALADRLGFAEYGKRKAGYAKLIKTRMQMAAYRRMAEEWIGEKIPKVAVLVALRDEVPQWLEFTRKQSEEDFEAFCRRLDRFYQLVDQGEIHCRRDLDPYCVGQRLSRLEDGVERQAPPTSCRVQTLPQVGVTVPQYLAAGLKSS